MSRRGSDLTPLRGKVVRRKFLVVDFESKDGDSQDAGFTRPFLGCVRDDEGNKFFFRDDKDSVAPWDCRYFEFGGCVDKVMRFILQRKYRGYHVYAHNAGRFDYLFMLPWLMLTGTNLGWNFQVIPVASSIQVLDVWEKRTSDKRKGDKVRFLDSMKLIPTSLQKAAEGLGVAGKNRAALGEQDLNLHEDDPRWEIYCGQDCDTLYDVVEQFHHYIEDVLLGEVGITAPSTAVKLLRRQYLARAVPRSVETHEFIRRGYFGGRVEPFEQDGEGLSYFDINSSYPASMRGPMPAGEAFEWDGEPPERFKREMLGFCECDVFVPYDTHIPVLPVKVDEKLIFPTGHLSGVWTYPELMLAVECGARIVNWKHSVWYKPVDLFGAFVADLYAYRDKSNPKFNAALEAVVKIILNSLYGKFGMKTTRKKIYIYSDPEKPDNAVPAAGGPEALVWYAEEEVDAPYIMPQVSAWVTSMSRILLMRYMLQVLAMGGKVYYCDTDSVIANVTLPSSTLLGELKDEIPDWSGQLKGEFIGPKMYILKPMGVRKAIGGKCGLCGFEGAKHKAESCIRVKAKGLESGQRNEETIRKLMRGAKQTAKGLEIAAKDMVFVRRLEKVGTLAQDNFRRGPKMRKVPRRLLVASGKREILEDGSTKPISVKMWGATQCWDSVDNRPWPVITESEKWKPVTRRTSLSSKSTTPSATTKRKSPSSKSGHRKKTGRNSTTRKRPKRSRN